MAVTSFCLSADVNFFTFFLTLFTPLHPDVLVSSTVVVVSVVVLVVVVVTGSIESVTLVVVVAEVVVSGTSLSVVVEGFRPVEQQIL